MPIDRNALEQSRQAQQQLADQRSRLVTKAYADAAEALLDAELEVVAIPSPGLVERDGEIIPASYMNFYIGNATVVVPLYGAPNDAAAVEAVQALFPNRKAVGLRADHILTGGGSFHCISQQVPV